MRVSAKFALLGFAALALFIFNPKSHAATVTFEGGTLDTTGSVPVYTENGLQFALYGDAHLVPFSGGTALTIGTNVDVIIARVGGGPFRLNSFLNLGPNYTGFYGWVNASQFASGGNNKCFTVPGDCPPVGQYPPSQFSIDLSSSGHPPFTIYPLTYDARWGAVEIIDWCGYCVTAFGAGGGIDDVNFDVVQSTPLPATLPLFATGLGALGVLG